MSSDIEMVQRIAELEQQLAEARARITTLEGHLQWVGWSSEGVEQARQDLAAARARIKELESPSAWHCPNCHGTGFVWFYDETTHRGDYRLCVCKAAARAAGGEQ